ncbi:ABC transporter substrate-binding protein [Evansella sp. AB-rgal1]|uniref:ABC transporter substrate-binding protein n=1 Tax=Evansella sp. AB-rgal1 TaxID=3242696 RepID=UPI00359DC4AF
MKRNHSLFFFLSLLFISIFLVACGDGEQETQGQEPGTTSNDADGKKSANLKKITIAEPVHLIGYLPLYIAVQEGYFEEAGLDVEIITATGGGHVTSLVSGEVWANIGGPESNEMANGGSPDPIVSVVNVVNKANVYLMAEKGTSPADDSDEALAEFLKGKTLAAGRYGGSPNLLTRWMLLELGLDPDEDVSLEEPADAAATLALVDNGVANIANGAEPQIIEGVNSDVWEEPFFAFPSIGDYPYSVLSVRKSSIEEEPEVVEAFVHAVIRGLEVVYKDKELAESVLRKEFPTLSDEAVVASLERAYEDEHWSLDGYISEESLALTMEVVSKTGIHTDPYSYDELIDMQFVESY